LCVLTSLNPLVLAQEQEGIPGAPYRLCVLACPDFHAWRELGKEERRGGSAGESLHSDSEGREGIPL
jgi:hypothetical protein